LGDKEVSQVTVDGELKDFVETELWAQRFVLVPLRVSPGTYQVTATYATSGR
jgi:hypothetical protein